MVALKYLIVFKQNYFDIVVVTQGIILNLNIILVLESWDLGIKIPQIQWDIWLGLPTSGFYIFILEFLMAITRSLLFQDAVDANFEMGKDIGAVFTKSFGLKKKFRNSQQKQNIAYQVLANFSTFLKVNLFPFRKWNIIIIWNISRQ